MKELRTVPIIVLFVIVLWLVSTSIPLKRLLDIKFSLIIEPPSLSKETGREKEFESARSTMLHYFVRPDTDKALHDHPWDFTTTILAGSYQEHLPTEEWHTRPPLDRYAGPAWGENIVTRSAGETIHHLYSDLHCIGSAEQHTWSLITTRERTSEWGFHPENENWQRNDKYLAGKKVTQ